MGGLRHWQLAGAHRQLGRRAGAVIGQQGKGLLQLSLGVRVQRLMVDWQVAQPGHAVVPRPRHPDDLEMFQDQLDRGQEPLPVEAALVELAWRGVGRRDHHHAGLEQALKQATQDHGVGDVLDLELVEAEEASFGGDAGRDLADRGAAGIRLPALLRQAPMDLEHELVEVHAALGCQRCRLEQPAHQHRLAAPDRSMQVQAAAGRQRRPAAEAELGQQARRPGRQGLCLRQQAMQLLQPFDRRLLGRVRLKRASGDSRLIATERIGGRGLGLSHGRRRPSGSSADSPGARSPLFQPPPPAAPIT